MYNQAEEKILLLIPSAWHGPVRGESFSRQNTCPCPSVAEGMSLRASGACSRGSRDRIALAEEQGDQMD